MAASIYITSGEGHSGKSTVALGVVDRLTRTGNKIGVFRPIARSSNERDYVVELLLAHDGVDLDYDACIGVTYDDVHDDHEAALSTIIDRFHEMERACDVVVIVGSDFTDVSSPAELGFNARIAANLGAPVMLVATGHDSENNRPRTPAEVVRAIDLMAPEITAAHARLIAIVVNRSGEGEIEAIVRDVSRSQPDAAVWAIPEEPLLTSPTLLEIQRHLGATLIGGDERGLQVVSGGTVVSAMGLERVLERLFDRATVVVPGDRSDVILGALLAHQADTFPQLAGLVVNGGFGISPVIERLMAGLGSPLPILATEHGTFDTAQAIMQTRGRLSADSPIKVARARELFAQSVDGDALVALLDVPRTDVVTPLMFEHELIERARQAHKRIVLPEGEDDRILIAAALLLRRRVAEIVILGDETAIRRRATELGIDISAAEIIGPLDETLRERFAEEYTELRRAKGMTLEQARDRVTDSSYFGTMMVRDGLADGMVSGAAHTTAHTIRPAFEVIRTAPGVSIVSSVFLMALADRVLVYGDCAVNPDPTAEQLADIAISSAETAEMFGIEPRVAMLSYSTGESGSGADVDKVRQATALVREKRPDLLVEGPIQYDAAADAVVAAAKMPDSQVAGRATVFIFPDLNTGNNTYKAVQRSAGAVAMGPILQGLNKPVNDLSRGALVHDIVNTVAITAIQAATEQAASGSVEPDQNASGPVESEK